MPDVNEKKSVPVISALFQRPDGNYSITVNGETLGLINAQTYARFVLSSGETLTSGIHKVSFKGFNLKVQVKDIAPNTTFYEIERIEPDYREHCRISKRQFDAGELNEKIARAKKHNDATMKEILERVVVTAE